ncbi:MAG: AsmA-like C-terminal region-containing protein [Legionella sp.]|jgi:uncharacterized protein YhdP
MNNLLKSILKKIWLATALTIVLVAAVSSLFRALTPLAKQYKGEVEQHLSVLIGQPVTIKTMETGWYWFQPVLKLDQITIGNGTDKSLHLEKLLVGINLFKSLWEWQIQPGVLFIDDIHLVLREKDGQWSIDGISTSAIDGKDMTPARTQEILVWLAEQERLVIRHVSAYLHFSDGGLIPVRGLNISVQNKAGTYKFKGDAQLDQINPTSFQLLGELHFDPYDLHETKGHLYFAAKHIIPAQWQSVAPKMTQHLEGGKGDVALWLDINKGLIASIQAQVNFENLAWRLTDKKKSQVIQSVAANLSWKALDTGWQLDADQIQLRMGGVQWPENKLMVQFDKNQQNYQLFVQSLIIESVLSDAINWPDSMQNILKMQPKGVLSDTQIFLKDQQLTAVLTRFNQLSWNAQDTIPEVHNLSGVLNWQPQEGHLELDSEKTTVALKSYPVQKLDVLNAAVEWKELNDGMRLSIDRFVVSQKDLTVTAEGVLDEVTKDSLGRIRLNATYAGDNAQKWIPYIPKQYLKPKLYEWLSNNIKHIGKASATVAINGFAKDFPFDNGPGEFTINAHASNTALLITPKWPLIKSLEGYIKVNKRSFVVDLVQGDFHGVPVKQMNLRIDDIGHDKETLLIHTVVNAQAQKMLNFVMLTPLKQKLAMLNSLTIKGLLTTNLQLEVPLYPENDDVIAKGDLNFKDNSVVFNHQLTQLKLDDFSGTLTFDDKGIIDSAFIANIFGDPLNIKIQTVAAKEAYTSVQVSGERTIDSLKKYFDAPFWSYLKGSFYIYGELKLTDTPNDFDTMELHSNLQGLAINLPQGFGKPAQSKAPTQVSLAINETKGIKIKANYDDRISSDISFNEKNTIKNVDLLINKLTVLNQNFDKLSVQAKLQADKDWSLHVEHSNIVGTLLYHPLDNSLSGLLQRLRLADFDLNKKSSPTQIHPMDIPNLNVRIENLALGTKQLGSMTLKTKSTPERLAIDFCRIDSSVYQIEMQGAWTQKDSINQTKIQVRSHVNDLGSTLERWNTAPAVKAGKGDMEFSANWNKNLFDFSLKDLNGTMYIKLKKGIITHLSPETEEKLGLGKLLSILSLQTIPRRLQLDFSDLSHEGYSFDIFKGNFTVTKGIMSTQDSYLDGPVAYAGMKGDLDLVRHLYDLDLKISPHITASLPIVATIAGGPVAGLAAWVANKIINQGMQKISAYSYKISGPWNQPVVQQISMVKKILAKDKNAVQFVDETQEDQQPISQD